MTRFILAQWHRIRTRRRATTSQPPSQRANAEPRGPIAGPLVVLDPREVAERVIVFQLLRADEQRSRADLESEVLGTTPLTISEALEALRQAGVIEIKGEIVELSQCARHLESIGMVSL